MNAKTMLVCLLCISGVAHAQTFPPSMFTTDGQVFQATFDSSYKGLSKVEAYFITPGNNTTAFQLYVEGPKNVKVKAFTRSGAGALPQLAAFTGGWNDISFLGKKGKGPALLRLGEIPSQTTENSFYIDAYFHFQKDACAGKSATYSGKIEIDLSEVDPAAFDAGFVLKGGVKAHPYKGADVASIKPRSDGKYFGEPIILMASIGYGGEYVNKVKWGAGKIRSSKRFPIVKYVSYKGYGLSLGRLKGHLGGGKHTFELTDGGYIYGVCFDSAARRQTANGYPMP